jgi:hypothetical protein
VAPPWGVVVTPCAWMQALFPNADVIPSTFDAFAAEYVKLTPSVLPVITSEIGDTWIHGVASDPRKAGRTHILQDARADCIASGQCDPIGDNRVWDFSRLALKNGEHTWGLDCKTNLNNYR